MKLTMLEFFFPSESETLAFGAKLANACPNKCLILLKGELGAGKTTLVRGFLRGLGYNGAVKSPTYTLVEPYEIQSKRVYHFDLYRLSDLEELEYIGLRDYLADIAIILIEWPERAKNQLPTADVTCYIRPFDSGRRLQLVVESEHGCRILHYLT